MKKKVFVVLAIILVLIACYYLCPQPDASYVKPIELNQQINALAQGLNTHWISGEVKPSSEGRAMTFVVKERKPVEKEWTPHRVGTSYVATDVDWQPKAQTVSLFCIPKEKLFAGITISVPRIFLFEKRQW